MPHHSRRPRPCHCASQTHSLIHAAWWQKQQSSLAQAAASHHKAIGHWKPTVIHRSSVSMQTQEHGRRARGKILACHCR